MSTRADDSAAPAAAATRADTDDPTADLKRHLRTWLPRVILAMVLVVHIGLVRHDVRARHALDHDEVISQVAATGHLDDWRRLQTGQPPGGRWATGRDYRRFTELDAGSTLGEVRAGLADLDIHPPLYFWALLGARNAGLGPLWSGALLNLGIAVLAGAVLYVLLVRALRDRMLAALAIAVFAFSPALVRSVAFARQYPLLMLLGVALIGATSVVLRRPRSPLWLALFSVIGLLGLLTAHEFILALGGAVLVVALRWWRSWRDVVGTGAAAIASALVSLAIFPASVEQYERVRDRAAHLPAMSLEHRSRLWLQGFLDLVTLDRVETTFEVLAVVGGLAFLATSPWWLPPALRVARRRPVVAAAVGVGGVSVAGATAAFVVGTSPPHAYGWQYLVLFWPAIVLVGAVAVQRNLRRPALVLLVTAVLLGAFAVRGERTLGRVTAFQRAGVHAMSTATIVITDCADTGYVPGAAMWASSRARFLVPRSVGAPPPLPSDADRSRPVLLHTDLCNWRIRDADRVLAQLGFRRGPLLGRLGQVGGFKAYLLRPSTTGAGG